MKEYIEKEAAINAIEDTSCYLCKKYISTKKCDCDCEIWRNKKMLHGIPPADVKPVVKGEWEDDTLCGWPVCSKCGYGALFDDPIETPIKTNFCPNCGAAMTQEAVGMLKERNGDGR